jgi:two-component system, LytTR family, sensor kinase
LNPILKNRIYFYIYTGVWLTILLVNSILLLYSYDFGWQIAVTESIVFNILFAFLGLGLWFPIYYSDFSKSSFASILFQQLFACIISVGIWLLVSYLLLEGIFSSHEDYIIYLKSSLPWRIGEGILFYLLIVLSYYLITVYNDFKEKLVKESELKSLVKESELKSLKSQINPHFLFNSLNSISSLTIISPEKAQEMVIKLSDFLRYSLSHSQEPLTSLEEELTNINRYLDIEKTRFGKRLHVEKQIDDSCYSNRLPSLILQPLIENAIKHGLYESIDKSSIVIECKCTNTLLEVILRNDYDPDLITNKGEGIGISNIKRRMGIMYNRDNLLSIHKTNKIFEVTLRFPQIDTTF